MGNRGASDSDSWKVVIRMSQTDMLLEPEDIWEFPQTTGPIETPNIKSLFLRRPTKKDTPMYANRHMEGPRVYTATNGVDRGPGLETVSLPRGSRVIPFWLSPIFILGITIYSQKKNYFGASGYSPLSSACPYDMPSIFLQDMDLAQSSFQHDKTVYLL